MNSNVNETTLKHPPLGPSVEIKRKGADPLIVSGGYCANDNGRVRGIRAHPEGTVLQECWWEYPGESQIEASKLENETAVMLTQGRMGILTIADGQDEDLRDAALNDLVKCWKEKKVDEGDCVAYVVRAQARHAAQWEEDFDANMEKTFRDKIKKEITEDVHVYRYLANTDVSVRIQIKKAGEAVPECMWRDFRSEEPGTLLLPKKEE